MEQKPYEYQSETLKRLQAKAEAVGRAQGRAQGEAFGRAQGEAFGRAQGEAFGRAQGEAFGRAQGEVFGRVQGEVHGEAHGRADSLLMVLQARGVSVSAEEQTRIRTCSDITSLNRWIQRAVSVASVDELFHD